MNDLPLSLEAQFELARLKLHLQEHPEQAPHIAIKQFQFHLEASAQCQRLQAQLKSPSLPPFLTSSHRRLQTKYDRLRTEQIEVLQENVHLRQAKHNLVRENQQLRRDNHNLERENQQLRRENHNQRQRIHTLTQKSALLPDFLSRNLFDK